MIARGVFGTQPVYSDAYNESVKLVKDQMKTLNNVLKDDKRWLVGDSCTLADIYLAVNLIVPFQVCLDGGYQKAMGNVCKWFQRVTRMPAF